eukprot:sb/3463652/
MYTPIMYFWGESNHSSSPGVEVEMEEKMQETGVKLMEMGKSFLAKRNETVSKLKGKAWQDMIKASKPKKEDLVVMLEHHDELILKLIKEIGKVSKSLLKPEAPVTDEKGEHVQKETEEPVSRDEKEEEKEDSEEDEDEEEEEDNHPSPSEKVGGKTCPKKHPILCRKFSSYGTIRQSGCAKGRECKYFHRPLCKSSERMHQCYNPDCRSHHLKNTRRVPPGEGVTAAGGTRVQSSNPSNPANFQLPARQLADTSRHDDDPTGRGPSLVTGENRRREVNCSKLLLINGRSLNPSAASKTKWKMRYLEDLVVNADCPVMAVGLTETWWDSRVEDAQVIIPGYNLFRSDREGRTGGGCALLVHASLIITDKVSRGDNYNNMAAVYIPSCHTILAVIYRTREYNDILEELQRFIDKYSLDKPAPDLFIMGDLNLPKHSWDNHSLEGKHKDVTIEATDNFTQENFLTQVVNEATRFSSLLDVILTNRPDYFVKTEVEESNSISDHRTVVGTLGYNMTTFAHIHSKQFERWSFNGVCYHKAREKRAAQVA